MLEDLQSYASSSFNLKLEGCIEFREHLTDVGTNS